MKKFLLILSLSTFISSLAYAKKPIKKNKKTCYSFFTKADEDKSGTLSFIEFNKFKKPHKKGKNKISNTNLFKKIDSNSDEIISDVEYKDYCIAKNTKIKKQKKGSKAARTRKEPTLPVVTKKQNVVKEAEIATETDTTQEANEPSQEDMEILDTIKDSD